ncbi:MAG: glucose-1-phosphate adenylyltransferase subunit GlgD [Peptococcaceae bacterium]
MHNTMGIIMNTKSENLFGEITQNRCMSAVPFGGRYRLIDFILSNMVNCGMKNISLITSHKFRSLLDHLGKGKEWGLDRKSEGLLYLPSASPNILRKHNKFDLKDLDANFDYLQRSRQQYVFITGSNMLCNFNLKSAFSYHKERGADLTLIYKEERNKGCLENLDFLSLDFDGRVNAINHNPGSGEFENISMEMIIMERELLMDIINVASASGNWDLAEILAENIDELKIYGYPFKGYLAKINSIENYFRCNMDLLKPEIWRELFFSFGPIYTKSKDGPPAKYENGARTRNVLVATGCNIKGSIENSVIFRGVTVAGGTQISNSIIMQKSVIGENAVLENVILDKDVTIRKGVVLKGDRNHPIVIGKKTVI